jgi:hypothetical protein
MPVTCIKPKDDLILHISTIEVKENETPEAQRVILVTINECDVQGIPVAKLKEFVDPRTEEEFHKNLRKDALIKDQFLSHLSTNPEWNETNCGESGQPAEESNTEGV